MSVFDSNPSMNEGESTPIVSRDRSKLFHQWYSRADWGAVRHRYAENARGPVSKVYFHYNTKTPPCYGADECFPTIRSLQEDQIRREMNDIAYNFLVASGGNIYEGRGFGVLPSAHLRYAYGDRLDIAFIGEWTLDTLPYNMYKTGMILIELGLERGYIQREWLLEAIIPKKVLPKEEQQMQRFLNKEKNRKRKKRPKRPPRRGKFGGKYFVRQYLAI